MNRSRLTQVARLVLLVPVVLVTGVWALVRAAVDLRPAAAPAGAPLDPGAPREVVPAPTRGIRIARGALVAVGVAGLLVAALITVTTVRPQQYGGVLLWLAAAIVLHDGVLAAVLFGANRVLRGAGARIPAIVLAILQVAVLVGAIFTLVVVPELRAQQLGVRNPTVLPMDYALHLGILWGALAVLAAVACAVALRRRPLR